MSFGIFCVKSTSSRMQWVSELAFHFWREGRGASTEQCGEPRIEIAASRTGIVGELQVRGEGQQQSRGLG